MLVHGAADRDVEVLRVTLARFGRKYMRTANPSRVIRTLVSSGSLLSIV
jgi:hypothetical protein